MATENGKFAWKANLACVSAFKIMLNLQQFDKTVTFKKAETLKLSKMAYYPATTSSATLIQFAALLISGEYSKLLARDYVIAPQTQGGTWKKLRRAMEEALADKDKTLSDLAEVVDAHVKFADE